MKYRKKPVEIEAVLWDGNRVSEATEWISEAVNTEWGKPNGIIRINDPAGNKIIINTLEGEMTAMPGDYIIKGVKGELYPCKPDIFEMTYEKVI
jgi:hypothetical protein